MNSFTFSRRNARTVSPAVVTTKTSWAVVARRALSLKPVIV